jgi:hypothetical protein
MAPSASWVQRSVVRLLGSRAKFVEKSTGGNDPYFGGILMIRFRRLEVEVSDIVCWTARGRVWAGAASFGWYLNDRSTLLRRLLIPLFDAFQVVREAESLASGDYHDSRYWD